VLEVPEAELMDVAKLVKREMENVMELDVPLVVELSCGPNWSQSEKIEVEEID
jgi:DNA polymerase I-like protein with 3'-5' exonuclease and polymerase domains